MKKIIILCITTSALISNHHIFGMLRNTPITKKILYKRICTNKAPFNYKAGTKISASELILILEEENSTLKQENSNLKQKIKSLETTPVLLDRDFGLCDMNKE